MGKVNKKDQRKRGPSVTDGLDPMDPSSYSDAPRGGWYSLSTELTNPHLKSVIRMTSYCCQSGHTVFKFLTLRQNVNVFNLGLWLLDALLG
jgi:hypothetical protein